MNRSQRRRTAGPRPCPSLPTTIASGPRRSVWRAVSGASASEPATRRPCAVQVGQRPGQVVDRAQQEVLDGAGRRLDRGRGERRLAAGREDDPVDAGRLGAAQQRARRSADPRASRGRGRTAARRARRRARGRRPSVANRARLDDERDALVAVEPGERGQRPALDLDDRDAQARRVQDELLERARDAAARPAAGWAVRPAAKTSSTGRRPATSSSSGPSRSGAGSEPGPGGHARSRNGSRGHGRMPGGGGPPERCARRSPRRAGWTAERGRVGGPWRSRRGRSGGRSNPPGTRSATGSEAATGLARRRERAAARRSAAVGRRSRRAPVGASRAVGGRPAGPRAAGATVRDWRTGRLGPRIRARAVATGLERPRTGGRGPGGPPGRAAGRVGRGPGRSGAARPVARRMRRVPVAPPRGAPGRGPPGPRRTAGRAAGPAGRARRAALAGRPAPLPAARALAAVRHPCRASRRGRSAMAGLRHPPPALAVAGVLDGDAVRRQLVAQPVRGGEVACGPRGLPRLEQRDDRRLEIVGGVGQHAEHAVEVAQRVERPAGIGASTASGARSGG